MPLSTNTDLETPDRAWQAPEPSQNVEAPYAEEPTKNKFTEETIRAILRQVESGFKRRDICRQYGISEATFYRWKTRTVKPSITPDVHARLRTLEEENARLKRIVAELTLTNAVLKETNTVLEDELDKKAHHSS